MVNRVCECSASEIVGVIYMKISWKVARARFTAPGVRLRYLAGACRLTASPRTRAFTGARPYLQAGLSNLNLLFRC